MREHLETTRAKSSPVWRATTGQAESTPDESVDRLVFRHAMAGLMGLPDTPSFLQAHLDHHVRQVERLLRSRGPGRDPRGG